MRLLDKIAVVLLALASHSVLAQTLATETANEAESDTPIEETRVIAPRTVVGVQRQIERADVEMYRIFSELNDDPQYDVRCVLEKRYGSNVKRRVCKAGYEREINRTIVEQEARMAARGEPIVSGNYGLSDAELSLHRAEFRRRMEQFAATNEELAAAIYRRAKLQRSLVAMRGDKKN